MVRAIAATGALLVLTGFVLVSAEPAPPAPGIGSLAGAEPTHRAVPEAEAAAPLPGPEQAAGTTWLPAAGSTPPTPQVEPGTEPVELALPAHDVRAPVVPVSTGADGALVVPDPPSTVGWWSPSALAGSAVGTTVIAGHIDSAVHGVGALAVLREVVAGEKIILTGADGREIGYRVTSRRRYAKAELPPEVFAAGGPARLVLITCGGEFNYRTRHYEDNVVVYAEPS